MSRILLADDSPHAQRMGERILSGEGFEVVTISDGDSALIRLEDVDPDIVLADIAMPHRSGYEICQYIKLSPRHRHVRVVLTAGADEPIDEAEARRTHSDGLLRKPFEASALLETIRPLAEAARLEKPETRPLPKPVLQAEGPALPFVALIDPEQVRAAVTVALDASMASMVDEITRRVISALAAKPASAAGAR